MTEGEICREYRLAKDKEKQMAPLEKQIAPLAKEHEEIIAFLRICGEEQEKC